MLNMPLTIPSSLVIQIRTSGVYLCDSLKVELASGGDSSGDEDEEEVIEVREVTKEGFDKATSAQFDLLRVLGQGSFGKVRLADRRFK